MHAYIRSNPMEAQGVVMRAVEELSGEECVPSPSHHVHVKMNETGFHNWVNENLGPSRPTYHCRPNLDFRQQIWALPHRFEIGRVGDEAG